MIETTDVLVFFVNGKKIQDSKVNPEWTLLYYLRSKLRLCGTKLGCGEGGCGACTVMVSKYDRTKKIVFHIPVNACLAPVLSMHGLSVTTVEGIGSTKTKLHPVQERVAKSHGSQCGFCTPGIVMSMYTLLRNIPEPSIKDLEVAMQGNLCRCTGYRPIIEGYKTFTCGMGDKCCRLEKGLQNGDVPVVEVVEEDDSSTQEVIFPPELKLTDKYDKEYLTVKGDNVTWYRPISLLEVLYLKSKYPTAKIVVGNTEVGVEVKFKHCEYPVIIQTNHVKELAAMKVVDGGVLIGASVTLADLQEFLQGQIDSQEEGKTRIFVEVISMLHWFASKQIRSVGSIGGNLMTGSPISDLIPIFMAAKAKLHLVSKEKGSRMVFLDEKFFTGYRKNILEPDEILQEIMIPFTRSNQYFKAYKQSRRREDDIAIVNEAVMVTFKSDTNIIEDISFGFGGMAPTIVTAPQTQKALKGLPWTENTLEIAYQNLLDDLPLQLDAPGGMVNYRKSLALSLFFKSYLWIKQCLLGETIEESPHVLKSSQYYTIEPEDKNKVDTVHRPLVHLSAFKQATGEAVYCDDMPFFENELSLAFVLSKRSHAKIIKIDFSEAEKVKGYQGCIYNQLGERNFNWGFVERDEKIFYWDAVTSHGQVIAAVVADDELSARKAANKVRITYDDLQPVILTIEDAVQQRSFYNALNNVLIYGDVDSVFKTSQNVLEGEGRIGGQEHFYMEPQSIIVVPKHEDDEMDIYASTQSPSNMAESVAKLLGVHQNKICVHVKRVGGGFGGKETKSVGIAVKVAAAARHFGRPVRCVLSRDDDFCITGGRNPMKFNYRVAFDNDGRLLGFDVKIFLNCGYSLDYSGMVAERAISHIQNAYNIRAVRAESVLCKTNIPSNTAFRGFGGPQAMFVTECMINQVAKHLNKQPEDIRLLNLCKEGDITPYNQPLTNCNIGRCWQECLELSNFHDRRQSIQQFNNTSKYKKRGISVVPTIFGIGFGIAFANQGGALVLVYTDGSVLLTHGGIEMGQGLHTKMIQIASKVLEIPIDLIHTSSISNDKVPNTFSTAASFSSDINGVAVMEACGIIKERLEPYKSKFPDKTWKEWVLQAYFDRVSLSATGFCKIPDIGYDWSTSTGNLYHYFSYGVACSEVEIDTLTGDHKVLSTNIVMDLGKSLNPAIDVGQIEGGFMQGYGLFMMEELVFSSQGELLTRGPGTYKIPAFDDIPQEFNVSLLKGSSNPKAVYSSKAIGEPPLFLASSVLFAIVDAIEAARKETGRQASLEMTAPFTSAKIRMACLDNITDKMKDSPEQTCKQWNVIV